jgi:hypothetical protein
VQRRVILVMSMRPWLSASLAGGASYLRNFTRLLVGELLAGAAADALKLAAGLDLPSAWRAVAPGLAFPVALAPGFAARNLSRVIVQYSNELNYYTDAALAAAQVRMVLQSSAPLSPRRVPLSAFCMPTNVTPHSSCAPFYVSL